ncbi:MAG: allantoate amidohydrolase [Rhizobiales bacterium]|nr:allantoate amidohydrolase [Hyphomicrobiales bacterium]
MTDHPFGSAIVARLDELATITDVPGQITRLYLSPAHRRAATLVESWMRDAGMTTQLSPLGDVIGRYEGENAGAPALIIGSHIDSVRDAGRFDGTLGVATAIEIVRRLHRDKRRLPFAIEVAAFGDEEGVRFPTSLAGSRAMAGVFDEKTLDETDRDGVLRRDALKAFGCPQTGVAAMKRSRDATIGYVEVHIEQGPVLEAKGLALGVVTAINGCSRGSVVVTGEAGHAGTVPMPLRRDALAASSEMILAIERLGSTHPDLVATVGQITVPGGAINTVPGRVEFSLDARAPDDARRHALVADIRAACASIAARRNVSIEIAMPYDIPAAPCDPSLSHALAQAVARCGHEALTLPSGAGHDAMSFRGALPFTMLFVRCREGVSHNPAEFASVEDIDAGARALADFVDRFGAT